MNRFTGIRIVLGFVLFIFILFIGVAVLSETEEEGGGDLTAYFLKTEEDADCTVIMQGEYCVMIDTGEERDKDSILKFLEEKNITEIEYLILTHPDADHIGNAKTIIENFEVNNLIEPYFGKEKKELEEIYKVCNKKNVRRIIPVKGRNFMLGTMLLTVYPPLERHYKNDNNYSLIVKLVHDNVDMLFAGDAVEKRIGELADFHLEEVDIYKAAFHGRDFVGSIEFLEKLSPEIAVVTASKADDRIAEACEKDAIKLYYTREGTIIVNSDGEKIQVLKP